MMDFVKSSILDVWLGTENSSDQDKGTRAVGFAEAATGGVL